MQRKRDQLKAFCCPIPKYFIPFSSSSSVVFVSDLPAVTLSLNVCHLTLLQGRGEKHEAHTGEEQQSLSLHTTQGSDLSFSQLRSRVTK